MGCYYLPRAGGSFFGVGFDRINSCIWLKAVTFAIDDFENYFETVFNCFLNRSFSTI